jgi:hypothetical protein
VINKLDGEIIIVITMVGCATCARITNHGYFLEVVRFQKDN